MLTEIEKNSCLTIEKQVYKGFGFAKKDGKAYFAVGAIAGDTIEYTSIESHKNYEKVQTKNIIKASPYRQKSKCDFSTECGGCQWLEMDYDRQIFWKRNILSEILSRDIEVPENWELVPSLQNSNYRTRVTLRARFDDNGCLKLGFFRHLSRDFVEIDSCYVSHQSINNFITSLKDFRNIKLRDLKFRFEIQILPDASNSKNMLVTIISAQKGTQGVAELIGKIKNIPEVRSISSSQNNDSEFYLYDDYLGVKFYTKAQQFQQINQELNRVMQNDVYQLVKGRKLDSVLDLFCGSGNLSLPLANEVKKIVAVENNKNAIKAGNFNKKINKISNIDFIEQDVERYVKSLIKEKKSFNWVVLDPPRQGVKGLVPNIEELASDYVLYISCDPMSFARDIKEFKKFKIEYFKAFDFFPHTFHVESFCLLKRVN
ncbi:MAG: 23S rRNA (uracil(1939)-C(5))-methyltransferase RlmD [Oligoflexales bacterium]|nr:23S rRNA (uracil(1939)-C(5))-methyltransferase RlmD [Oligoflexales bacterium]